MKLGLSLIFILFTAFMVTFSWQVVAQGNFATTISTLKTNQQSVNQQNSQQKLRVKSSNQAAQLAQSRFGGKVLKVLKVQAKKSGYRVKLIKKDGHIIAVFVDAKSGRISGR
jgi:uncharacterized membrane protein YkoI